MDQELIAYLDARFREASQQVTSLRDEFVSFREETSQNFRRVDEEIRQVHVVVEDLRGEVHLVAEGVTGAGEQLNAFKAEVAQEFKDVKGLLRSSHTELDRRLRPLEMRKRI
jgi:hypothetical protein